MGRSVSILAFSDRGGRGGGLGGFLLPALLLAGGGVVTWYFVFGPGKGQIIGTGTGISNYFNGLYNTARDYAIYLLIGGILLQLIYAKVLRGTGTVGGFFALTSWIMMIVGGLLTLTNFSGVIAKIPGIGANIRQLTGSNYAMRDIIRSNYTKSGKVIHI